MMNSTGSKEILITNSHGLRMLQMTSTKTKITLLQKQQCGKFWTHLLTHYGEMMVLNPKSPGWTSRLDKLTLLKRNSKPQKISKSDSKERPLKLMKRNKLI